MKYSTRSLACIIAVLLGTAAQAEIYEGKDAEGNTVFTDSPAPGATRVDLPQSNIADAVKPSPADTPAAEQLQEATKTQEHGGNVVVIPDSHNEEIERVVEDGKPHEVLDAEQRYEVGDTVTPEEAKRRIDAKEGIIEDAEGNKVRIEHRGHVGGHR